MKIEFIKKQAIKLSQMEFEGSFMLKDDKKRPLGEKIFIRVIFSDDDIRKKIEKYADDEKTNCMVIDIKNRVIRFFPHDTKVFPVDSKLIVERN